MEGYMSRKMRLIEGNAKSRHLKFLTFKVPGIDSKESIPPVYVWY
jgi:hypothetical protein